MGYTNAGKTTLFNKLTSSKQYAADKLFATLDSVTRRNIDPELGPILFSDTVGFISDLPTELIESFKATLDELQSADLLLHVTDCSDDDHDQKIQEVDLILNSLGLQEIPKIMINNKCDLIGLRDPEVRKLNNEIWISAEKSLGIEQLRDRINKELFNGIFRGWVSIESSMGKLRSELYSMGCILKEENSSTGRDFLNIDIGREELDKLLETEGFNICSDEDILLANEG